MRCSNNGRSKYIYVFAVPFALTLIISDFTALLHNNGTSGIFEYVRIIYECYKEPIGRNLALVWLGKFAIYGVSFALPSMTLSSMELAGTVTSTSFWAISRPFLTHSQVTSPCAPGYAPYLAPILFGC